MLGKPRRQVLMHLHQDGIIMDDMPIEFQVLNRPLSEAEGNELHMILNLGEYLRSKESLDDFRSQSDTIRISFLT
jgi:hypothetical protein